MANERYTEDHEWVRIEGDTAVCGISDYAQEQLGDVVFVELPEVGRVVSAKDEVAVVESVKAASDIYAPISGEVVAVNSAVEEDPETVNRDALGKQRCGLFSFKRSSVFVRTTAVEHVSFVLS